jgi:hypothetical protein
MAGWCGTDDGGLQRHQVSVSRKGVVSKTDVNRTGSYTGEQADGNGGRKLSAISYQLSAVPM